MAENEARLKARAIWDSLDLYGQFQVARWGTAFTTYEDEGDDVCRELNSIADEEVRKAREAGET
jgi:hypothetical protein